MLKNERRSNPVKRLAGQRARRDWSPEGQCAKEPIKYYDSKKPEKTLKPGCDICPVLKECSQYAIVHQKFGYWGGMSEHQRTVNRSQNLDNLGYIAVRDHWLEDDSQVEPKLVLEYEALVRLSRLAVLRNQNRLPRAALPTQADYQTLRDFQEYSPNFDFS